MKEQYMTLVTPCNVAITMAEQSNNVDALLEAIGLKLAVLSAADEAPPENGVSGAIKGAGWAIGKEGGVGVYPAASLAATSYEADEDGKITQRGVGPFVIRNGKVYLA